MTKFTLIYRLLLFVPPLLAVFFMFIVQIDLLFFTENEYVNNFIIEKHKPNYRLITFYLEKKDTITKKIKYDKYLKIQEKKSFILKQSNFLTYTYVKDIDSSLYGNIFFSVISGGLFLFLIFTSYNFSRWA